MEDDKKKDRELAWSPWGQAFLAENFIVLHHSIVRYLAQEGLAPAEILVILALISKVRYNDDSGFVTVSYSELCEYACVGKNTVKRVLSNEGSAADLEIKRRVKGTSGTGSSVYDLNGFWNWLRKKLEEDRGNGTVQP